MERKRLGKKISIAFDQKNNLIVSSKAIVHVQPKGARIIDQAPSAIYIYQTNDQKIFIDNPLQDNLFFFEPSNMQLDSISLKPKLEEKIGYWNIIQTQPNRYIVYSYDGEIINMTRDGHYTKEETSIKRGKLYQTSDTSFLITNLTKGAHHFIVKNDSVIKDFELWPNTFISTVTHTADGEVLLGTFGKGIHVIPSLENKSFEIETEGEIRGLCAHNNLLYFSTSGAEIGVINNGAVKLLKNSQSASLDKVFYLEQSSPGILTNYPHLFFNQFAKKAPYKTIKNVYEFGQDQYLIAASNGVFMHTKQQPQDSIWKSTFDPYIFQLKAFQVRSRAVVLHHGNLVIGSVRGLFVIEKDGQAYELQYQGRSINSSTIEKYNGKLLIGSHEFGVLALMDDYELQPFQPIQKNSTTDYIRKIIIHSDVIYILTDKGIEVHDLKNESCNILGVAEGVSSSNLLNFAVTNNNIWVLSNGLLTRVNQNKITAANKTVTLEMGQMIVNDQPIDFNAINSFSYGENNIEFHPSLYDFSVFNEVQIYFKLNGFEESWHLMNKKDFAIQYKSLPPGQYELVVKASYKNKSTEVFRYAFDIDAPYWQKTWFFILMVGVFVGITTLFFALRIRFLQRRNKKLLLEQEREKAVLQNKLKALRSQMNPHFIFNSINSIQDLILKEDTDASYDYVVLLSELVRSTLSFSEKEFITLQEEIQYLEAYLGLEKLRFKSDFEYTIENKVKKNPKTPSLMIQPFVENSLQHGLFHKTGEKKVDITFELYSNHLKCTISDNGIGRSAASKYQSKNKGHESFSLNAIQQRMDVFKSQYDADFHYTYNDLKNEKEEVIGTSVVVTLPYK